MASGHKRASRQHAFAAQAGRISSFRSSSSAFAFFRSAVSTP